MTLNQSWTQVWELTLASMKSRYRKTWAGFLWVILNPLLMFGVQSLVFRKFLKIDVPDYFLFLLGGLLPWIFFTQTVQMGTPIFVVQSQLLRSFKINPMVILGAQVLDSFINFIVSFLLIMLPFYLYEDKSLSSLIYLPLAIIPLLLGTLSFTISLSVLNVFYRDINFVMSFVFSLLFFLTPIFYPVEYVPLEFRWLITYNPIVFFIEPFRIIIHQTSEALFFIAWMKGMGASLAAVLLTLLIWKRKQNDFYRKL